MLVHVISLDMKNEEYDFVGWLIGKKIIVDTKLRKNVLSDQETLDELIFLKFIGDM